MRLRTPAAILATAVLAVGLSTVTTASAAQTSGAEYIYACKAKTTGLVRIVTRTTKCKPTEVKTWWTKQAAETQQGIATAGPQGERGPQGIKGDAGPIGPQGPAGLRGLRGVPGVKGETGKPGADGKDGAPGKDGVDGKDGQDATAIKYQVFDLAAFGIPGVKGKVTCANVSSNPAVLEWGNCKKGGAPVTPAATPTATSTPTGGGWTPDPAK